MKLPVPMQTLRNFVNEIPELRLIQSFLVDLDSPVVGITSDSRKIKAGMIFVAIEGQAHDGHLFIESALEKGALVVLGEKDFPSSQTKIYIQVKNSRRILAQLASFYYGNPSRSLLMIGVTGTSGKTTTTFLIESILKVAGFRVGVIGTISFRFGQKQFPSTHTTPGPVELQELLLQMKDEGCNAVVMEVSSHALKQNRPDFIAFDGMVFMNLSPEHLDFHLTMEDYYSAKVGLFTRLARDSIEAGKMPVAVINAEDSYGQRLIQELNAQRVQSGPSIQISPFQVGHELKINLSGIQGKLQSVKIDSPLIGQFNCENIAAATNLALRLGIAKPLISEGIAQLKGVPGRLERIENPRGIHIWVDYAHKPDALEKVLTVLGRIRGNRRLITVFGCGGDRDRKKRPLMGQIAVKASDQVFITSDNPRTEDPMLIIEEICAGTQGFKNFSVQVDRRKAIHSAIEFAKEGDLVLIAGKGHEEYQILGREKIHFDDREVVSEFFHSS